MASMDNIENGDVTRIVGPGLCAALGRASAFLAERDTAALLESVGSVIEELAVTDDQADKRFFPATFGGGTSCDDDLLTGLGPFYVCRNGRLMLDGTSGHYQMTWGYNHPDLMRATAQAMRLGIVWDNHANVPGHPVTRLAHELVSLAGAGFDRVMLGVCTGSVACMAALKIMLLRYHRCSARVKLGLPVFVVLEGNYHGTSIVAQTMRGMWPGFVAGMETVQIEPNDTTALEAVFKQYGRRIAGFWAEPIMMNREAILVDRSFLARAGDLCAQHDAVFALDEIQTGFWYPEVFMFRRLQLTPDIVVIGKGMTAGFHPMAGLIFRSELDVLEQYDALSTNGNAALAAFVALCSLSLIGQHGKRLEALAELNEHGLRELVGEFPDLLERMNGCGYLAGLRFREREDAIGFHRSALARGLWLRVHAYHAGHRTVLMKYSLSFDEMTVRFVFRTMRELLAQRPWRNGL